MNGIQFDFDWENPQGVIAPELAATWAQLMIQVDGTPVTQVHDYAARSVRSGIYLPLYPLAEWLVMHWWPLLNEPEVPRRAAYRDYPRRHNLRFAREGFALPDLALCPLNGKLALDWRPIDFPACGVRFLSEGAAVFDAKGVEEALTAFIDSVVARLEIGGLRGTPLQEEWNAIRAAAPEERRFCQVAGTLGLDPYSLSEEGQAAIIRVSETLPAQLADDFFAIADLNDLAAQATRLQAGLERIRIQDTTLTPLLQLRDRFENIDILRTPWAEGYAFARQLRRDLQLQDQTARTVEEVGAFFGLSSGELRAAIVSLRDGERAPASGAARIPSFFDALVGVNDVGSPGFLLEKQRESSRVFAFCRALFEYLTASTGPPVLISSAFSERQKRNRAFAAEFLAPSEMLNENISGDLLDMDEVEDLAARFGVSPLVIRHQLENHHLAKVVEE